MNATRVIRDLAQVEELRPTWTGWREHRDADIDVYRNVVVRQSDGTEPFVISIECGGRPDAILVGSARTFSWEERIGYWTVPTPKVRALTFQYGGLLGNKSEQNCRLAVNELERSLGNGEADVAILRYLPEDSFLYRFATHATSRLMRDHFPVPQSHWVMDVPKMPNGFYALISGDHRKKLRAEAKKIRAAFPDLQIIRFRGLDCLDEMLRNAEHVAASTYQRRLAVGFSNTHLIRDLLALEAQKGWLRGYSLYAGGQPCAFWIGCVYNDVFLSEYLGYDPAYAKHSAGTYLMTQVMEELSQEVTAIDFGIGEALYKQRFGNRHWNEGTVYLYAPTWAGMRVKTLRSMATLLNSAAKTMLGRVGTATRVKKLWRQHLTPSKC